MPLANSLWDVHTALVTCQLKDKRFGFVLNYIYMYVCIIIIIGHSDNHPPGASIFVCWALRRVVSTRTSSLPRNMRCRSCARSPVTLQFLPGTQYATDGVLQKRPNFISLGIVDKRIEASVDRDRAPHFILRTYRASNDSEPVDRRRWSPRCASRRR